MKTYLAPLVFGGSVAALRLVTPQKHEALVQVGGAGNTIGTVVELLQDIVQQTNADEAEDGVVTQQNKVFCSAVLAETEANIGHEKEALNAAEGQVYSNQGKISAAQGEIDNAMKNGAHTHKELEQATAIHKEEGEQFEQEQAVLLDSLSEVTQAKNVLNAALNKNSLLSTSAKKSMMKVVTAVDAVSKSIGINMDDHNKLKALLQSAADDEDDDFDLALVSSAPQATTSAYENKSDHIVAILDKLQDEAEDQLNKLRQSNVANQHNFAMMQQTLNNKIKSYESDVADQKQQLSAAQADLGGAQKNVASAQSALDQLQPYFKQTTGFCQKVEPRFLDNQQRRNVALNALKGAVDILSDSHTVSAVDAVAFIQNPDSSAARAAQILKDAARKIGSVGLEQIASKVSVGVNADQFGKVTKMIEDMVDRLQQQASEEATHKSYCDAEIAKNDKKLELKTRNSEKLTARKERAKAAIEDGNLESKQAAAAEAHARSELQQLNKNRNEETDLFHNFKENSETSLAKLLNAIEFVSAAYPAEGESFIQNGDYQLTAAPSVFEHKQYFDAAKGPGAVLETVHDDLEGELISRTTAEAQNKQAFQEKQQMLSVEIEVQKTTKVQVDASVKRTAKALTDTSVDLEMVTAELEAINKAAQILNNECQHTGDTFEERAAKREEEITSLREALRVLNDETA